MSGTRMAIRVTTRTPSEAFSVGDSRGGNSACGLATGNLVASSMGNSFLCPGGYHLGRQSVGEGDSKRVFFAILVVCGRRSACTAGKQFCPSKAGKFSDLPITNPRNGYRIFQLRHRILQKRNNTRHSTIITWEKVLPNHW